MGADSRRQPVEQRADLEVDGLEGAEGALDLGQRLVGAHRAYIIDGVEGQAGADHVDAVQRRLLGDGLGFPGEGEVIIGDGEREDPMQSGWRPKVLGSGRGSILRGDD